MEKRDKKKGGLQRKVSSVFKQISVPQQEGNQQLPTEPAQDGSHGAPSRPMSTNSLVSKSSLMKKACRPQDSSDKAKPDQKVGVPSKRKTPKQKKVCQPQDSSDKAKPDQKVGVPSKRKTPKHSNPQVIKVEDSPEAKISTNDENKADCAGSIPSGMMRPDDADSQNDIINEPTPSEDISSKAESQLIDGAPRPIKDESTSQHPSVKEPQQTENVSEQTTQRKKSYVPPKLTTPDHPISQSFSTRKTERKETARDKDESAHIDISGSKKLSAAGAPASRDSLIKKIYQAENTPQTSSSDRVVQNPPASKSVESKLFQNSESEKGNEPKAPQKDIISSTQPESILSEDASSLSLWHRINNRLFASQSGTSSIRQKAMMISIPILVIILIFAFRQVLSTSPTKTKGAPAKDVASDTKSDAGHGINWKIPELLPAMMRDPAKLPADSNTTQSEEQNQTANTIKSDLINLGAIVYSQNKSSAVVNGRIVHVGDVVNGITILRINKDCVEFEKDNEQWVQKIRE